MSKTERTSGCHVGDVTYEISVVLYMLVNTNAAKHQAATISRILVMVG
jgi:hypothetical protein